MLCNKYLICKYISRGNFGHVYKCVYQDRFYAIKEENINKDNLKYEATIYKELKNINYIATIYDFFTENNKNYLVLSYYDINLVEYKFKTFNSINYMEKIILIIKTLLNTLMHIHQLGIVHRDLKPSNICLDKNNNPIIIDFGLSKKIINKNIHVIEKNIFNIIGSYNFVSINVLNLKEPTRRDDLESLILIYLYLILNEEQYLNYSNANIEEKTNIHFIENFLQDNFIKDINNYTENLLNILCYIRKLNFSQKPNYSYIQDILLNSL